MKQKRVRRKRRSMGVRKWVRGTNSKPRMTVFKSNRHLFVQLIDDEKGYTLLSASTLMNELAKPELKRKGKESARYLGAWIAEKAKQTNIQTVVFDRGSNKYHGLLAELASAAREGGLQF
ncbi:MAG TPA: 50S ribosomal protein L18 [Rhabdochlamydiaceae bacterium]